jgi:hypothetical protein
MTSEKIQLKDASKRSNQAAEGQDTTVVAEERSAHNLLGAKSASARSVWNTPRIEQAGQVVPLTFGSAGPPNAGP